MQPDHESDDLETLLREEYGAPPLDKQFSADLLARLQVEATSLSPRLKTSGNSRRSLLAICVGFVAVAASIFAVLWILNRPDSGNVRESARREKTEGRRVAQRNLDTVALESESVRPDSFSTHPRTLTLSESLSERPESESKFSSEARTPRNENLASEERALVALSKSIPMSVPSTTVKEWPNVSAAAALADMLYMVDGGRLYEVNPNGGSRRSVGDDRWQNTAVMSAAGNYLYLVGDDQLFEVNPKTGARRSVGKPDWAGAKAILTVGDKLYIVSGGLLHRVNPSDGSHEVLHSKTESLKKSSEPKH
ncbi:MAG: hypothetical protein ACKVP0_19850 [Pirellulaceae bacterium]